MSLTGIFLISVLFFSAGASAGQINRKKIAILNFKAYNTSQTYADGVRDILEVNLYKTGVFHILEREQIDVILREHEIRDKWCEDQGCAVEIGKLLSTDKVVVGSLSGMGDFSITIKLVDIKNGDVEYADTETARGEKKIPAATQILADRFAKEIKKQYMPAEVPPEKKAAEEKGIFDGMAGLWNSPYRPYYLRGLVPGWGQIYTGRFYKGIAIAALFSAAAVYTGYAVYDFRTKRDEYEDLTSGTDRDFDRKHDSAGDALNSAKIMLWVSAALYLLNYADILFLSRPDYKSNTAVTSPLSPFLSFDLDNSRNNREKTRIYAGIGFRY